jgi:hypothetical protein
MTNQGTEQERDVQIGKRVRDGRNNISFVSPLGTEETFVLPVFSCENELIPAKFLYNSYEIPVFQRGPQYY